MKKKKDNIFNLVRRLFSSGDSGAKKKLFFLFLVLFIASGFLVVREFKLQVYETEGFSNPDAGVKAKEEAKNPVFISQNYLLPLEQIKVPVRKDGVSDIDITAKAVLAIDGTTKRVLYKKNAEKRVPIASLTKLTTALTLLDLADKDYTSEGEVIKKAYGMDRIVTISPLALDQEGNSGSLAEGEKIKASDLMEIMLIESSNDAAWALAEDAGKMLKNGGKVSDFVGLMNDLAEKEGLENTHFANPTGMDERGNYSSAWDVARVTQKFFRYYPEAFAVTRIDAADVVSEDGKIEHRLENTNKLLGRMTGIIGGKTGYTDQAGESLMLVVKNPANNSCLIFVVIGADDRFKEMEKLVNWVLESYEWK